MSRFLFRCAVASLYEVVSVRPSVGPQVRPVLFSKVKSTHTRRILCRVSGLVLFFSMSAYTRHFLTNSRSLFLFLFVALNVTVTFSLFTQVMEGKKCNIYPCVITSETTRTPSFTLESGVFQFLSIFFSGIKQLELIHLRGDV